MDAHEKYTWFMQMNHICANSGYVSVSETIHLIFDDNLHLCEPILKIVSLSVVLTSEEIIYPSHCKCIVTHLHYLEKSEISNYINFTHAVKINQF